MCICRLQFESVSFLCQIDYGMMFLLLYTMVNNHWQCFEHGLLLGSDYRFHEHGQNGSFFYWLAC